MTSRSPPIFPRCPLAEIICMKKNKRFARATWRVVAVASFLIAALNSQAVLFQNTGDPAYNTTAPKSPGLANSGWELQGYWGSTLGTPIAPQYFIAARHVGGTVGQPFVFRDVVYTTVASFDDPNSDLRIWKVNGVFPDYARLYSTGNELGQPMVVLGRGTTRGPALTTSVICTNLSTNTVTLKSLGLNSKTAKKLYPNAVIAGQYISFIGSVTVTNSILNGWSWGDYDGVVRWGRQTVCAAYDSFIVGRFPVSNDPDACHLSAGDSSGAAFVHDGTSWKLAGIHYAVEGPFQTQPDQPPFQAALLDKSGLYKDGLYFRPDGSEKPSCFYSTRIFSRLAWIQSIIGANP
jgi:hypothetical protein